MGSTAKPSGTLGNLDSRMPKGHTAKPKGSTAKPSGTPKNSDSNLPSGHRKPHSSLHSNRNKALGHLRAPPPAGRRRDHTVCGWSGACDKKETERERYRTRYKQYYSHNHKNQELIDSTIDYKTKYDRTYLLKIFMATKPASASWGTPPRGEPGEPRPLGLRTLSSQQRGAIHLNTQDHEIITEVSDHPRKRTRENTEPHLTKY